MDESSSRLRAHFATMSDDELIELRQKDDRTEIAYQVLDELLAERGVSAEAMTTYRDSRKTAAAAARIAARPTVEADWTLFCRAGQAIIVTWIVLTAVWLARDGLSPRAGNLCVMIGGAALVAANIWLLRLNRRLARAMDKEDQITWVLLSYFLMPLLIGPLVAFAVMRRYVREYRAELDAQGKDSAG
ncbi:MAG: hypothetical protein QM639_14575 [Rhodocyclaceae bacterium]